jgi:peptidoglycan/LPS O-acetylase OafA/YrhL
MVQALISTRNETTAIARGGWLDALRFIVAFLIILHHFQAAGPHALAETLHPVFERGGFLLTNFFLIDSGYVLMRVYQDALRRGTMSPGDFVLKRVLRVVPAHLMMILSLAGLVILSSAAGVAPRNGSTGVSSRRSSSSSRASASPAGWAGTRRPGRSRR